MKKKISIFALLAAMSVSVAAQAASEEKKRIAVYVTGGKTESDNNVLTAKLRSAITASHRYEAVERTSEFLQQLRREQRYQQSGNVDDSDIARLGREAGVQYVCVAELVPVPGGDFITARLIDVETASVVASADGADRTNDLPSLMRMSGSVAAQLIQNASYRYTGIAKKRVAVYVSGADKGGANKVLGVKLVSAITKSNKYAAMERTDAFLRQLDKEKTYQRSGNVDDNQLARLGKQFGVQYVCAAKVSEPSYGGKFLDVSLIDVETAVVIATANDALTSSDMASLMSVTQTVASQLLENAGGDDLSVEQVAEIPEWFFKPQKGMYVGVSLPLKNFDIAMQQAIYVALMGYMLQLDCEGVFKSVFKSMVESSERFEGTKTFSESTSFSIIHLKLPVGYEITQMAKNKYGELFVALRVPENATKKIAMVASSWVEARENDASSYTAKIKIELAFENGDYQLFLKAYGDEDNVEISVLMNPEKLSDELPQAAYEYTATRRRPEGGAIPQFRQSQSLKQSLGWAYLMALLGIFEEEIRNAAQEIRLTSSKNEELDISTSNTHATSNLEKHRAIFISEKCIIDNTLYINTFQP